MPIEWTTLIFVYNAIHTLHSTRQIKASWLFSQENKNKHWSFRAIYTQADIINQNCGMFTLATPTAHIILEQRKPSVSHEDSCNAILNKCTLDYQPRKPYISCNHLIVSKYNMR